MDEMDELIATEVKSVEEAQSIFTVCNIPEETGMSGFAFSQRLVQQTGLKAEEMASICEAGILFPHTELATELAKDSAGSATTGANSITIKVASGDPKAGSAATYIMMDFGKGRAVRLEPDYGFFAAGQTFTWDLNLRGDWLEDHVSCDRWDEIGLRTRSTDGIKIERIKIIHTSQTILDWTCNLWLDANLDEPYGRLVLTAEILKHKLSLVGNLWIPQIHWAARELGKTDGTKYGAPPGDAWCSEFASWCFRRAHWSPPNKPEGFGSADMEEFFANRGRMFTHDQILDGTYKLHVGDYLRYEWADGNHHSGIFVEYIDSPFTPTDDTRIRAIEGNSDTTVRTITRRLRNVLSAGNCR